MDGRDVLALMGLMAVLVGVGAMWGLPIALIVAGLALLMVAIGPALVGR